MKIKLRRQNGKFVVTRIYPNGETLEQKFWFLVSAFQLIGFLRTGSYKI